MKLFLVSMDQLHDITPYHLVAVLNSNVLIMEHDRLITDVLATL